MLHFPPFYFIQSLHFDQPHSEGTNKRKMTTKSCLKSSFGKISVFVVNVIRKTVDLFPSLIDFNWIEFTEILHLGPNKSNPFCWLVNLVPQRTTPNLSSVKFIIQHTKLRSQSTELTIHKWPNYGIMGSHHSLQSSPWVSHQSPSTFHRWAHNQRLI